MAKHQAIQEGNGACVSPHHPQANANLANNSTRQITIYETFELRFSVGVFYFALPTCVIQAVSWN